MSGQSNGGSTAVMSRRTLWRRDLNFLIQRLFFRFLPLVDLFILLQSLPRQVRVPARLISAPQLVMQAAVFING